VSLAPYVCHKCMPYMYALYACLICVSLAADVCHIHEITTSVFTTSVFTTSVLTTSVFTTSVSSRRCMSYSCAL